MQLSNHKKHLEVGEKYCEIGICVLNFASETYHLETSSNGKKGQFEFKNGLTVFSEIKETRNPENYTIFNVLPNYSLFRDLKLDSKGIISKAKELNLEMKNLKITVA